MTEYSKIYEYSNYFDTYYIKGYKAVKDNGTTYEIIKETRTLWNGHEIVDGWEVMNEENKRIFYASTLKEAKQFIETNCD